MKKIKKIQLPANTLLTGIMDSIVRHSHIYSLWDGTFFFSSAALLIFWILVHMLVEQATYVVVFADFLRSLIIALGVGLCLYLAMVHLPRYGRILKLLANMIFVNVFLCTSLGPLVFMISTVSSIAEPTEYFSTTYYEDEMIRQMIAGSRFWGSGGAVSGYPDAAAVVAECDWRLITDYLLVISEYMYGSWVVLMLAVILAVWCVSAIRIYLKVFSRWFEWVFIICFLAVACQMIPQVLLAAGILPSNSFLFDPSYLADPELLTVFLLVPMATMLAIIKRNNDIL